MERTAESDMNYTFKPIAIDSLKLYSFPPGVDESKEVSLTCKIAPASVLCSLEYKEGKSCLCMINLASSEVAWRAGKGILLIKIPVEGDEDTEGEGQTHMLTAKSEEAVEKLEEVWRAATLARKAAQGKAVSAFDRKTDKGSADLYFHYYGMLQHQQNMLQDYVRTGNYYAAIMENRAEFEGKAVMDVGAGSGILSLFAAQAGARVVYAVEASNMADFAAQLAAGNTGYGSAVQVIRGKVEEIELEEKVDVLVSEPMGTLLVNERMLETYLFARDKFLKPGGKMFPQMGRLHVAAFMDEALYTELINKAGFWLQPNFYGVDVTHLHQSAVSGYFAQVVVDAFDPNILVSGPVTHVIDFRTTTEDELSAIHLPLRFQLVSMTRMPGTLVSVHGCAAWFDVQFQGCGSERWLSTAPGLPTTHWFQLRCVLEKPITARIGDLLGGEMKLLAHERQSYDVFLTLTGPPLGPDMPQQVSTGKFDLKEPYYRQLTTWFNGQGQQNGGEH